MIRNCIRALADCTHYPRRLYTYALPAAALALAALLAATADGEPTDRMQAQALFEAGITLGEMSRGQLAVGALARDTSLPEEFLAGVLVGQLGRDRFRFLLEASAGQASDPPGIESCDTAALPPPVVNDTAASVLPVLPGASAAGGGLESFGEDSFWIRLGDGEAPGIFMLADPACPYSARALAELAPDISAGRLHVRLALAPVLSELSRDLSALIMLEAEPAQAAWAMLLGSAQGAGLPPAAGTGGQLGELGDQLLAANLDWMRQRGLAAVPHFVWASGGNWQQRSGVQDPIVFGNADRLPNGQLTMHAPAAVQAMIDPVTVPVTAAPVPALPAGE